MGDIIEVHDVRFVVAQDKPRTVRAMHKDMTKAFLNTQAGTVCPVIEFLADTTQQAKAAYVIAIDEGTIEVVDDNYALHGNEVWPKLS